MAEERVQRRLAAILAADVVGYSRLMRADEAGTLAQLKTLRRELLDPKITEYGGRIVKTTGDGMLIEFPSAVDAVQHAVDVQQAMGQRNASVPDDRRMEIRMGINIGDVIVDGDDLFGDGVNVAARLEGLADPGGICVSGSAHEQVRHKLDLAFEDMGEQSVKNIDEPVRAYRIAAAGEDPTALDTQQDREGLHASSDKPLIAVLPFDNMSGDPEQEYFSDGMAEDLITDLSKLSNLSVAARNSSFSFKGQMPDISEVAEKLGVAFVLEGSVRKMGERLRINAQLIDCADGRHLWAERYDGNMAEIFEFQDAIREQIVSALQVSLTPTDKAVAERKLTESVEAYDLFLKGRANLYLFTPEHLREAIAYLEEAIEIDPNFADAYGYLSYCHVWGWANMLPGFEHALEKAHELAERGVALDSTSAIALMRLGFSQAYLRRHDQMIANFEKAIAVAPNNAEIHATFGIVLNYWGNPKRALEMLERAFSIETFAPPVWEYYAGLSHLQLRQYDSALARLNRAVERSPQFTSGYLILACTYAELDRVEDAQDAIKTVLGMRPQYTVEGVSKSYPYRNEEDRIRFLDALRKAGLPEGDEVASEPAPALPNKPSIAVLPFDNMSGDPEQEYFSDGLAEDLITDLSKISGLFVVARNSAFAYKGQPVDVRRAAEELGVRHVLEGSVRKAGGKVRINAQLIDAQTGGHIWADRYDGDLEDIFSLQDTITAQIVSALQVSLTPTDKALAERKPTDSVEAYDFFLKGRANFYRHTRDYHLKAMQCFEKAIEIDPKFADAYGYLSYGHLFGWILMWTESDDTLQRANELAERGVALDGTSAIARARLGWVQTYLRRYEEAIANLEKAIAMAPNSAEVYATFGQALNWLGNPKRSLEMMEKALHLETFALPNWEFQMGMAYFFLRRYDEALTRLNRVVERMPKFNYGYAYLACTYAELDQLDDARDAINKALEITPQFTLEKVAKILPYRFDEDRNRVLDSLRKAGVPQG